MKKFTFVVFAVFIFLCAGILVSCAGNTAEIIIDIDIHDLDNAIREQFDFTEHDSHGYDEFSFDLIKYRFGITEEDVEEIIMRKKVDFNNAFNEEILVLAKAHSNDKAQETAVKLENYKKFKLDLLTDYTVPGNEAQYYLVEASEIITEQQYVFWVVDTRRSEINAVIRQYTENHKTEK